MAFNCNLCRYGKVDDVARLIAAGADVNKPRGLDERTPLYAAAERGRLDVVQMLITAGADVCKARNFDGATPLSVATQKGHLAVVALLTAAGRLKFGGIGEDQGGYGSNGNLVWTPGVGGGGGSFVLGEKTERGAGGALGSGGAGGQGAEGGGGGAGEGPFS